MDSLVSEIIIFLSFMTELKYNVSSVLLNLLKKELLIENVVMNYKHLLKISRIFESRNLIKEVFEISNMICFGVLNAIHVF